MTTNEASKLIGQRASEFRARADATDYEVRIFREAARTRLYHRAQLQWCSTCPYQGVRAQFAWEEGYFAFTQL